MGMRAVKSASQTFGTEVSRLFYDAGQEDEQNGSWIQNVLQ